MTDELGFGAELRREGNLEILRGDKTFRDAFKLMLDSVAEKHDFEFCVEELKKST